MATTTKLLLFFFFFFFFLVQYTLSNVAATGVPSKVHTVSKHFTIQSHFPSWDQNLLQANGVHVDVVVATDGSGNYTKVMDAMLDAPSRSTKRYAIYTKRGIYNEIFVIYDDKWNLMMMGDGMDASIISGNLSCVKNNIITDKTASFAVRGKGFIAKDISFRNTAGPENQQVVAQMSDSDLSVFYRCGIFGYQDSLCANTNRQFYRECKISGRPWKPYSTTVIMQSYISDMLTPEGWLEWNESEYLDTLYYAEYKNYGPGVGLQNRVKWPNYHVLNDSSQAINFTVAQFISRDQWLPSTGVLFSSGFGD